MRKLLFASTAIVFAVVAVPASATVITNFQGGVASPGAGFTVVNDFSSAAGITGSNFQIMTGTNGSGASPANSIPFGTSYLSVLGGGTATISLGAGGVTGFQFDWGSIDSYNTLSVASSAGTLQFVPGTTSFPNQANGNQAAAGTNGLFSVFGDAGEIFYSITLASRSNSFEIDNLATSVPEPGTLALLGLGLIGLGFGKRRRLN
jgi:hypothetical protein